MMQAHLKHFLQALLDNKSRHKWHYGAVVKTVTSQLQAAECEPWHGAFCMPSLCL